MDRRTFVATRLSNRTLAADHASIMDIAPTVLKDFGVDIPKEIDGTPLL